MTWLAARGIARFTAEVDARNAASIALVERRLGFAFQDSYPDCGVTLNRYARPAG
jgi:hypothetical protein